MKKLFLIILFTLFITSVKACDINVTVNYFDVIKNYEYVCVISYEVIGNFIIIKCPNKTVSYNLKNVEAIEYINCEEKK